MKTGFFAFFVMLAIVFSYEVAFGNELGPASSDTSFGEVRESESSVRQTAENELQLKLSTNAQSQSRTATADESDSNKEYNTRTHYRTRESEGSRHESAAAIKGRY